VKVGEPILKQAASRRGEATMAMVRYMVVVERGESSWGAHVPDLPGCVAVGETREEALRLVREAIEFHIDGLKQDGSPIPAPSSESEFVEVWAA
jgi:predicted RNase H-like HicB family nuclease